jgi:hypothetical protein
MASHDLMQLFQDLVDHLLPGYDDTAIKVRLFPLREAFHLQFIDCK